MKDEERQLWSIGDLTCVMISCCAGAELQLRRARSHSEPGDREIILREMYPMKSDLYDRARDLKARDGPHGSEVTAESAGTAK